MSLREKINNSPALPIVLVIVVVAIAIWVVTSQFSSAPALPTEGYYSIDEGKTYFVDDIDKVVPFTKDGKEVVKVHMYECDGKKFVGYVSKMNPQAKAAVEAYHADLAKKPTERPATHQAALNADMGGWLFKKPGDSKWTPGGIMTRINVQCEDGKPANPSL